MGSSSVKAALIDADSRAVSIGRQALCGLGEAYCLGDLLNSPGNFAALKLEWVQQYEPALHDRIHKIMLPGGYVAMRRSGQTNMFLSPVFREAFVNTTRASLDVYNTDWVQGAARMAWVGASLNASFENAFASFARISLTKPEPRLQAAHADAFDQ
jgi:sugar (pentulose or hexulose) kinase